MIKKLVFLFLPAALVSSCGGRLDVDVSGVQVQPVRVKRMEKEMFSGVKMDSAELSKMKKEFGSLFLSFKDNVLCPSDRPVQDCPAAFTRFVSDADMKTACDDCVRTYPDLAWLEKELTSAEKYFRYHFPQKRLPSFYTLMSGFNYSVMTADTMVAAGLEMYLGEKDRFYEMMQIPMYKRKAMNTANMLPDLVRGWMIKEFPKKDTRSDLLGEMIYQGKILYLLDALIPASPDTIKIAFSQPQLDWCRAHEKDTWGFFIKNKLLYSSEYETIAKYTTEGPFTTGFVKESPARTGVWTGWQIVRAYMNEHKEVSLEALMNADAQKILSQSRYKP